MKGFLKKAFLISASTKQSINLDFKIAMYSLPIFIIGQAIQNPDWVNPENMPQFLRHHLTNFVDVPLISATLNRIQSVITKQSHPTMCASVILALGTRAEILDSSLPNRSFDWTDQSLFMATAAAYCLLHAKNINNTLPKPKTP